MKLFSAIKGDIVEFGFTFTSLFFSFVFFSPLYDDYGAFLINMASKQFSDFSFIDLHYMGFIQVNKLYKIAYTYFPKVEWMGVGILFFTALGLWLSLKTIKSFLQETMSDWMVWSFQLLVSLIYIDNFISLSHTRFSLLFCGLALLNLLFSKKISWKGYLGYSVLFLIGLLHRPESSLGMLIIVVAAYVFYVGFSVSFFKRFLFPFLFTFVLFGAITIDRLTTDLFINKVEPEIEYKLMDKQVVDVSLMETPTDSIKYEAAVRGIWFDSRVITPTYLRSILLPGINLTMAHSKEVFFHLFAFYWNYIIFLILPIALSLLVFTHKKDYSLLFKLLIWFLYGFVVLYLLDFNGLLVDGRHFFNIQLIIHFVGLYIIRNLEISNKPLAFFTVSFLLFATVSTLLFYKKANREMAYSIDCYEAFMGELEHEFQGRIIVATLDNYNILDQKFSFWSYNYTLNTYIMYDMFTFSLIPEYEAYLSKKCRCDAGDPTIFMDWLAEQKALYIAKDTRYSITQQYMELVHDKIYFFSPVPQLQEMPCTKGSYKKDFKVKQLTIDPIDK